MRAQLGHPAISRPMAEGSATATLAARLATLPMMSSIQGSGPLRLPWREARSSDIDDAAIIPSTEIGSSVAVHEVSPYRLTSRYMCLYDTIAAMTASTITLRVVIHRIARSALPDCASAMGDQSSAFSTSEETSSG